MAFSKGSDCVICQKQTSLQKSMVTTPIMLFLITNINHKTIELFYQTTVQMYIVVSSLLIYF